MVPVDSKPKMLAFQLADQINHICDINRGHSIESYEKLNDLFFKCQEYLTKDMDSENSSQVEFYKCFRERFSHLNSDQLSEIMLSICKKYKDVQEFADSTSLKYDFLVNACYLPIQMEKIIRSNADISAHDLLDQEVTVSCNQCGKFLADSLVKEVSFIGCGVFDMDLDDSDMDQDDSEETKVEKCDRELGQLLGTFSQVEVAFRVLRSIVSESSNSEDFSDLLQNLVLKFNNKNHIALVLKLCVQLTCLDKFLKEISTEDFSTESIEDLLDYLRNGNLVDLDLEEAIRVLRFNKIQNIEKAEAKIYQYVDDANSRDVGPLKKFCQLLRNRSPSPHQNSGSSSPYSRSPSTSNSIYNYSARKNSFTTESWASLTSRSIN